MNKALFSYIAACPTAYQAVAHTASLLQEAGYQLVTVSEMAEAKGITMENGAKYGFLAKSE